MKFLTFGTTLNALKRPSTYNKTTLQKFHELIRPSQQKYLLLWWYDLRCESTMKTVVEKNICHLSCLWVEFQRQPIQQNLGKIGTNLRGTPCNWTQSTRFYTLSLDKFKSNPAHCTKFVVQTNLPNIGMTYIFWSGMKSTFTWAMPYKSISGLVIA